jgi:hypothetical protein
VRILVVCSGLDFINYTRRATIEAIHKLNPDLEVLMYNSVLNIHRKKNIASGINFYYFHFWVVEGLRRYRLLSFFEYQLRRIKWQSFFLRYDNIFMIDPNQYYLLPYLNSSKKLTYLLRDPSVLMNPENFKKELPIIKRADLILGISKNLCTYYFEKYYGYIPGNVKLWSNTVDLKLWDYEKLKTNLKTKSRPRIGLAGNITYVIDIELLLYIGTNLPDYDFEIAGKVDLKGSDLLVWEKLVKLPNVNYLGFIPFNEFPPVVINWDVGLVAGKTDHEFARYLNNNKQYQYLALGKPFVSYYFNSDYSEFGEMVFLASGKADYINKIKLAYQKSRTEDFLLKGLQIASKQSAENRAKQFLELTEKLI